MNTTKWEQMFNGWTEEYLMKQIESIDSLDAVIASELGLATVRGALIKMLSKKQKTGDGEIDTANRKNAVIEKSREGSNAILYKKLGYENPTYTSYSPNPEWKTKGEKWIELLQSDRVKEKGVYWNIAYIPRVPLEVRFRLGEFYTWMRILPTHWKKDTDRGIDNRNNLSGSIPISLQGALMHENGRIGNHRRLDFDAFKDAETIFELLKIAEVIYTIEEGEHRFDPITFETISK